MKHARIEDNDVDHRASISETEILSLLGELRHCRVPPCVVLLLVSHQISTANATMRAHHAEGDLSRVEQPDEKGTRDVQYLRRLLRRQLRPAGE
jgi:hypothetical protein